LLSATTKRDERIRIARDLHDVLGHQLTALSLQLEVASHVKEDEKQRHIQQAKAISGLLLSNVRETVSEIRLKKDLELRESLTVLTEGLPGLKIDLIMELDDSLVDARQGEVIFRCVQEALTNTTKHANASHCKISLSDDGRHLVLSVEDDGNDDTEINPGNGLAGMAERVAKIDGQLNYQNTPEGFVLTIKLPKNQ
jgi:signal transduction histidine kinase